MNPKKTHTSYDFYQKEQRSILKIKYPTYKARDITKIIVENWNKITEKSKEKYEILSKNDNKRYLKEFEIYKQSDDFDLSSLILKDLKKLCKKYKLKVSGKKSELVKRLKDGIVKEQDKEVPTTVKEQDKDVPTTVKEQIDSILNS